jgi:hypothetical protein
MLWIGTGTIGFAEMLKLSQSAVNRSSKKGADCCNRNRAGVDRVMPNKNIDLLFIEKWTKTESNILFLKVWHLPVSAASFTSCSASRGHDRPPSPPVW